MSPENSRGNEEKVQKPSFDHAKDRELINILKETKDKSASLKSEIEESMKKTQDKPLTKNVAAVDGNIAIAEKDEEGKSVLHIREPKNEIIEAKNIIDGFIGRFPRQEKFLRSIIIPDVKITGEAYAEIYRQFEPALFGLDYNTKPRIVYSRPGEINRTETLNFADPNSKDINVQQFRKIIKEINAQFFIGQVSPFHPALYN